METTQERNELVSILDRIGIDIEYAYECRLHTPWLTGMNEQH